MEVPQKAVRRTELPAGSSGEGALRAVKIRHSYGPQMVVASIGVWV